MKKYVVAMCLVVVSILISYSGKSFAVFSHKDHIYGNSVSTGFWDSSIYMPAVAPEGNIVAVTFEFIPEPPPISFPVINPVINNDFESINITPIVLEEPPSPNLFIPEIQEPILELVLPLVFIEDPDMEVVNKEEPIENNPSLPELSF